MDQLSFSRTGKYCSNQELSLALSMASSRTTNVSPDKLEFKSLAEDPPILVGYNVDHGRVCRISSSPRVEHDKSQEQMSGQEIRYQRIIRWDDALILSRSNGGDGNTLDSKREIKSSLRPRSQTVQTISSSFRTCERGQDQCSVRFRQAVIAPPPGHYDISYDIVSKRRDVLGQINPVDRPNAPSYLLDRSSRFGPDAKETCSGLLQVGKTSVVLAVETTGNQSVSPRSALKRIRIRQSPNIDQITEHVQKIDKVYTATGEIDLAAEEIGKTRMNGRNELHTGKKKGIGVEEKDVSAWLFPSKTIEIGKRVPRTRFYRTYFFERSTATGYFSEPAWRCPDVWYRPNYEILPILQRHVQSPNLHHGGRDSDHHIQRLGFRRTEDFGNGHAAAVSHRAWIPKDWLAGHGRRKIRGPVFGKLTGRESINLKKHELRLPYRPGPGSLANCVCTPDSNPIQLHVPGFDLGRSTSSHDPPQNQHPYHEPRVPLSPSYRLVQPRASTGIPLHMQIPRRPITADPISGKEPEAMETYYDTERAKKEIVRPRSISPVHIRNSLGRPEWPEQAVPATAAGGLHGLNYWDGRGPYTEAFAESKTKRRVDMAAMTGRQ